MQIEIILPAPARVWHLRLSQRLLAAGHRVAARFVDNSPARPVGLDMLRLLEGTLYRNVAGGGDSAVSSGPFPETSSGAIDLCIDLSGRCDLPQGVQTCLVLLADGAVGEEAVLAALVADRSPELTVVCRRDGAFTRLSTGMAALEEPHQLIRSLDRVYARCVDLMVKAVANFASGQFGQEGQFSGRSVAMGPFSLAGTALGLISARIAERLHRLSGRKEEWRIGWRRPMPGTGLRDRFAWPEQAYEILPDDGLRYYADPFLFEHQGRVWLFCEEFPYATGRGLISVVELGPDGVGGVPRPCLEGDGHLSYPQVFAHEGAIYMIPETSGKGTIELWRCKTFPDRWMKVSTLISGISAADVTLLHHGDRWWLFAALGEDGQSSWDLLGLYHAPRLEGPWTAHAANPVVIDARAARPAGRMFASGGALWRPVQDCSAGYGGRLAFARIERLDPEIFVQTVAVSLAPPTSWSARGVHTLDALPGLEVIDVLCAPAKRLERRSN